MHLLDLFEKRRNPERNTAPRPKDVRKAIEPFFFRDDAYLSMVNIAKIGVNPITQYDSTPTGIYAYPLGEQFIVSQFLNKQLPHAGWAKYAAVLIRSPGAVMLTNSMTRADLEAQWAKLDDMMHAHFTPEFWRKAQWSSAHGDIESEAHEFYRATEAAAILLALLKKHSPIDLVRAFGPNVDLGAYLYKRNNNRPRIWNGLLRKLGFDAVEDRGSKMIHTVEPFQTCFLSTSAIANFSIYPNGESTVYAHKAEVKSAGHFFRVVRAGKIDSLEAIKFMNAMLKGEDAPDVSEEIGSYNPDIRFSDTQIRTFVQWVSETRGQEFIHWLGAHRGPWGIDHPRLRAVLDLFTD